MEYESTQADLFSLGPAYDSRGMEIVPIPQEQRRPFEDYLDQEIFNDDPEAQPDNFISASMSTINEINDRDQNQSQARVMYGTSLVTKPETEWVFKNVNEKSIKQPFFGAFSFQIKLEKDYFKKVEASKVKLRKRRTRQEIEQNTTLQVVNATSMALIYSYSIKNGLSRNGVDDLLGLVDNVTGLEFNKHVNKLQWRSIRSNFDKLSKVFSPIQRPEFKLDAATYIWHSRSTETKTTATVLWC